MPRQPSGHPRSGAALTRWLILHVSDWACPNRPISPGMVFIKSIAKTTFTMIPHFFWQKRDIWLRLSWRKSKRLTAAAGAQLQASLEQNEALQSERATLTNTVRKLEGFKRNLLHTLQASDLVRPCHNLCSSPLPPAIPKYDGRVTCLLVCILSMTFIKDVWENKTWQSWCRPQRTLALCLRLAKRACGPAESLSAISPRHTATRAQAAVLRCLLHKTVTSVTLDSRCVRCMGLTGVTQRNPLPSSRMATPAHMASMRSQSARLTHHISAMSAHVIMGVAQPSSSMLGSLLIEEQAMMAAIRLQA